MRSSPKPSRPSTRRAGALFQQAEQILLNDDMAVPINWYLGDYVYNPEKSRTSRRPASV